MCASSPSMLVLALEEDSEDLLEDFKDKDLTKDLDNLANWARAKFAV